MRKYFKYWKWLFPPLYGIKPEWVEDTETYYNNAVEWKLKVKDAVQTGIKTTFITVCVTVVVGIIILNNSK